MWGAILRPDTRDRVYMTLVYGHSLSESRLLVPAAPPRLAVRGYSQVGAELVLDDLDRLLKLLGRECHSASGRFVFHCSSPASSVIPRERADNRHEVRADSALDWWASSTFGRTRSRCSRHKRARSPTRPA